MNQSSLQEQIRKCFRDTYMQTEGDTELFDIEETIKAIELLIDKVSKEARLDELNKLHRYDGKDYDTELDEIIDQRVEELNG